MIMKRGWIFLLLLSILVTGCNASNASQGKKNEKTAKTQSKQSQSKTQSKTQSKQSKQKRPARTAAVQKVDDSKMNIVIFLNRAEHVVQDVYYAAIAHETGKTVHEDGITYLELPKRFDSKDKVIDYFSRFWSRSMAEALYDNLSTKTIKKKLYVSIPNADYPVLISVRNTMTETRSNNEIVASVQNATDPSFSADRTLRYQLVRDSKTKRYEIRSRIGEYGKEQFQ